MEGLGGRATPVGDDGGRGARFKVGERSERLFWGGDRAESLRVISYDILILSYRRRGSAKNEIYPVRIAAGQINAKSLEVSLLCAWAEEKNEIYPGSFCFRGSKGKNEIYPGSKGAKMRFIQSSGDGK